ncbi:MAG: OsmC family protein [Candidatus Omnitrophica bacterium]|nr:OsmC family protein [Candidatus Omnitrophota bacterium]MCM8831304.1 OsmC family protein [Candidatus Omnitrophota bacterium]
MQIKSSIDFVENDKFKISFGSTNINIFVDKDGPDYKAKGPNPLELFCASLGSCVGVFVKRYLLTRKIYFKKIYIDVEAFFDQSNLLVKDIKVKVYTDANLAANLEDFLRYIKNCPIHNTIINTDKIDIDFLGLKEN